jgi:hypothetical protein
MLDTYAKLEGLVTVQKVWSGASVAISASLFQMDSIGVHDDKCLVEVRALHKRVRSVLKISG